MSNQTFRIGGFAVKNGRNSFTPCHGMSNTKIYSVWRSMKNRCTPNSKQRADYFDRGIRVCERWMTFENFLADMGASYSPGLEIDRRNNDGNYEPGNCRWVTRPQNQANRRCSKFVFFNGAMRPANEVAAAIGIHYATMIYRIRAGWSADRLTAKQFETYAGEAIR